MNEEKIAKFKTRKILVPNPERQNEKTERQIITWILLLGLSGVILTFE